MMYIKIYTSETKLTSFIQINFTQLKHALRIFHYYFFKDLKSYIIFKHRESLKSESEHLKDIILDFDI